MAADIPFLPVLLILFLSTLVRSTFGFGDALVAMPLLALIIPIKIATPVVALIAPTIAISLLIKEWRHIDLKSTLKLILSTLAGIPIGILYLKNIDENVVNAVLALVLIAFSLYRLAKPGLQRLKSDRWAFLFGFVGGILGGAYNTNGPPVILYGILRGWKPESFRATLQSYFLPTGGAIMIGQGLAGFWTKSVITTYLYSLPLVFLAVFLGLRISRKIPAEKFNKYVYVMLLGLGIILLIKVIVA
jgi:uncharacterized membrane protein YfcA